MANKNNKQFGRKINNSAKKGFSRNKKRMSKDLSMRSLILPFIIGIVLGIIAKFTDGREFLYYLPVFADIMGRFGIWVWAAALIAIRSKTPLLAAIRSLAFFIGMLFSYYGYTVLILKFYPKSQMILWGSIAMITPLCGFLIWHVHKKYCANLIASLPFILLFTEWYLTAKDDLLLFIAYLCMTLSLSANIPTNKKRLFSLIYGLLISIMLIWMMQTGIIVNLYDKLLNI